LKYCEAVSVTKLARKVNEGKYIEADPYIFDVVTAIFMVKTIG